MTTQRQHGRAMIVMVAVAMVLITMISPVAPAQAVQTQGSTTNYAATFYAYVAKGERMRLVLKDHSSLDVYNEDGSAVPVDQNGYTPTARGDGVWRIKGSPTADARGFTYDMSVRAGTTEKPGRIFVYEDSIEQTLFSDLTYYGVSDLGYVYKIEMPESRAWTTKIALRSSGPAANKNCNVENRSFDASSSAYIAAHLDCGDKYRLFFEDPRNSGLPETAKMANETVQVMPKLVNSSQLKSSTKVKFSPNAAGGGIFNVDSHANFSGTADLQIDTNNNDSFTDTVDIEQTVVINQGAGLDWTWDGKDAKGAQVYNGAKARAVITKGGEAHLMVHDAEDFGGLKMTRLNGDAPDSKIYWDDSKILRERGGDPTPVKTCLNGCNSNVPGGIHGWVGGKEIPGLSNSGSWGDGTVINNWAYASVYAASPTIGLPKVYTLKFDGAGGKVAGSEITRTDGFTWGTLATATQANMDFLGWHTAKTSGTQVTAGTVAKGNITAYARWQVTPRTLTFDANGGSISGVKSITKPHGSAWDSLPTAALANNDFQGWFTTKTGGTQVTAATVATGNVTVYAQWKLTPRTLTFDATGGSISGAKSITKPHGSPWGTLPTAAQSGKVFLNWHTAKAGGDQVKPNSVATGNMTAYAQWRPARFNVVFYGNAQMGQVTGSTASVMIDSGCTDCRLPANGFSKTTGAPELIDHDGETAEVNSTFLGWSLDPLSRTGSVADRAAAGNLSVTDGATVRLYAIWDDAPRFIVTDYPDRFFNLSQAKAGAITEAELLSTVKATDKETVPLAHKTSAQVLSSGSDVGVTLLDYDAKDYTSLTDSAVVTATYKVKDEVGHVAFLRIRVSVSDEAPLTPSEVQYFRGISPRFADKEFGAGGLSAESLWRTDPTRQSALAKALQGGAAATYCLDVGAIAELRAQVGGGLGNSETPDGLAASQGVLREKGACP